jgi:galactokinase
MTSTLLQSVFDAYEALYGAPALLARAPGRINLIGEHTDYNLGFVLPAAIEQSAYVALGMRNDHEIHLHALDLGQRHRTNLDALDSHDAPWSAYVLGVVQQLQRGGFSLSGFNLVLSSSVPVGSGMSSSAAVECASLIGLDSLFGLGLDRMDMVRMAQRAENEYVGVKCGIMDMFASMIGRKDYAIQLDCRSLDYRYFPLHLGDYRIVLFDTRVRHSLAGGEYNQRRMSCEAGVRLIHSLHPLVMSLRDADLDMIEALPAMGASPEVYQRCRYVVEENMRLLTGCRLLEKGDIEGFGQLMFASHAGLRDLYTVSCPELDLLVELAMQNPAVAGARMMGGGFGGCTINLVKADMIDETYAAFRDAYHVKTELDLGMYVTTAESGAETLPLPH